MIFYLRGLSKSPYTILIKSVNKEIDFSFLSFKAFISPDYNLVKQASTLIDSSILFTKRVI